MRLVGHPEVIELPWFSSGGLRAKHADELDAMVGSWIGLHDFDDVVRRFEEVGAAIAPIYTIADAMKDPQYMALNSITTVMDEDLGPVKMQNVMFRMLDTPGRVRFPGRRLGQDNEQVYGGRLGLRKDEVQGLRSLGVI
jgi:crotonobetainyl-CoA:carnitine CoA-transferase CaiB-like acyl-CoA transferase